MALTITSLRVDYRVSGGGYLYGGIEVPYIIVNCCFKIEPDKDGSWTLDRAKAETEEYRKVLTIDDPKRYENWIMSPTGWNFTSKYDGYGRAWTHHDCPWQYLEKFDTFHFREWIADCTVTRAIIAELEFYKENKRLPSVYRTLESEIILSHLRTLQAYWD
jgi:hypothetical protein